MSNIKVGGAIFKETPTIANYVVGQTIDTINQQLNDNNTQNTETKLQLDFLKQVFIITKLLR